MSHRLQSLKISVAARSEKGTVARLLQLYLHDFSEFARLQDPYGEVDDEGLFSYEDFNSYWTDQGREALLIRLDDRIAGFALVNQESMTGRPTDHCMAEFFILRKYRRSGIGKRAAREIMRCRSGTWEIPVAHYNQPADLFWRSVVSSMADCSVEEVSGDGQRWHGTVWRLA